MNNTYYMQIIRLPSNYNGHIQAILLVNEKNVRVIVDKLFFDTNMLLRSLKEMDLKRCIETTLLNSLHIYSGNITIYEVDGKTAVIHKFMELILALDIKSFSMWDPSTFYLLLKEMNVYNLQYFDILNQNRKGNLYDGSFVFGYSRIIKVTDLMYAYHDPERGGPCLMQETIVSSLGNNYFHSSYENFELFLDNAYKGIAIEAHNLMSLIAIANKQEMLAAA